MPVAIGLHPALQAVTRFEFNVDEAIEILENAGWKEGASGIREKGGKPLELVVQTSTNVPRPKNQAVVRQARQKAGIELEPKSATGSVFFSSDVANSDTYTYVYCDMEMLMITMASPGTRVSGIRKGL